MAKFKMRISLKELEVEIEGSRDDVPLMTKAAGMQIAGLLTPGSDVIEGEIVDSSIRPNPPQQDQAKPKRRSPVQRRQPTTNLSPDDEVIDWIHDPTKWGNPQQTWVTAEKSMWLLYVVDQEKSVKELSARSIAATFNKQFRQSGPIQVSKVSRDLGKRKNETPALVSEVVSKDPHTWFLTQAGVKKAEELVTKARGTEPT